MLTARNGLRVWQLLLASENLEMKFEVLDSSPGRRGGAKPGT